MKYLCERCGKDLPEEGHIFSTGELLYMVKGTVKAVKRAIGNHCPECLIATIRDLSKSEKTRITIKGRKTA